MKTIKHIIIALGLLTITNVLFAKTVDNKMNTNPSITNVSIVALGSYAPDQQQYEEALVEFTKAGFSVTNYYDPARVHECFSETDQGRVNQLNLAMQNANAEVIIALRGGYGMSRLLPYIDFDAFVKSGKIFIGHSDCTALAMALLAHGGKSISGPMVYYDFGEKPISETMLRSFKQVLARQNYTVNWISSDTPDIDVTGVLWGGNLALLTHLVGTPYMPDISGGILFIEDVGEHPYRIERMVLQLKYAGILDKQKALVLGQFTDYKLSSDDNGYDFNRMVNYLRQQIAIPIVTNLPFGHIKDKISLPIGEKAQLKTINNEAALTILFE